MNLPTDSQRLPSVIQGGMGISISNWRIANAVARLGGLGVVSGTALDRVFAFRLQEGDQGGHLRRVLARFPVQAMVERVLATYFRPNGLSTPGAYRQPPFFSAQPSADLLALTVAANFAEVSLAKEGHDGLVGLNLLEKIQPPTLPSLYGAMLAGVDFVIMGAGIPRDVPGHLDLLAQHKSASLRLQVEGGDDETSIFDPKSLFAVELPPLKRPRFLPIITSEVLAISMLRRPTGRIDGFIVEGPIAGGHNAPPRGGGTLNEKGEPVYGPRDEADLVRLAGLGLPFWLAGGKASPEALKDAQAKGAVGIQVGTAFAFCEESGMEPTLRRKAMAAVAAGEAGIFTDPRASPTGFPFKVLTLEGSTGTEAGYAKRTRICNLGYLRTPYRRSDGSLGWRCAAEPNSAFTSKGGDAAELAGRKCLCNGLMATTGHPLRTASGGLELPILTSGDDLAVMLRLSKNATVPYKAEDVMRYLGAI